jgi:hypothetical protein
MKNLILLLSKTSLLLISRVLLLLLLPLKSPRRKNPSLRLPLLLLPTTNLPLLLPMVVSVHCVGDIKVEYSFQPLHRSHLG